MIRATELRLNNTISHQQQPCRVVALSHETIMVQYENGNLSANLPEEELEGIALTPQLLQKSGFAYTAQSNDYRFVLDEDAIITVNPHIAGGHSVQLCVKGAWCGKPVRTLHELQNIYLDLTGKELLTD